MNLCLLGWWRQKCTVICYIMPTWRLITDKKPFFFNPNIKKLKKLAGNLGFLGFYNFKFRFWRFFRKCCENRLLKKIWPIDLPKLRFEKGSFIYLRGENGTLFAAHPQYLFQPEYPPWGVTSSYILWLSHKIMLLVQSCSIYARVSLVCIWLLYICILSILALYFF